jgi:purine-binding chemotaxis protein CheW
MTNDQSPTSQLQSKTIKLVVFRIGNLKTALHIDSVQKIINYATIYSSGLTYVGVVNIGEQEITVIDLHKRLFNQPQPRKSGKAGYLILAKNSVNELFGIVIDEAPSLLDVPLATIRTVPASYRHADTLAIASHVTVIPQEDGELTIFILDADELVPPVSPTQP